MNPGNSAFRQVGSIQVRTNQSAQAILKGLQQDPKSKYIPQGNEEERVRNALRLGKPVIIEGPSGIGKTLLLENISKSDGKLFSTQMCSEGVEESKIIGYLKFASEGRYEYQDGSLLMAARASNVAPVLYYLDEVNMLREEIRPAFHSLLDHRKLLTYDVAEDGNVVNAQNFGIVMSYNPDPRHTLPDNWITRCTVIRLGYPEAKVEKQILLEVGGLKEVEKGADIAEGMVKFANAVRAAKGLDTKNGDAGVLASAMQAAGIDQDKQGELTLVRAPPSPRLLVDTCEFIVKGHAKIEDAMQNIYDNLLAGMGRTKGVEDALSKLAVAFLPRS